MLMQMNFLRTKRKAWRPGESSSLQSQCVRVEVNGHTNIRNREDEVIQVVDREWHSH